MEKDVNTNLKTNIKIIAYIVIGLAFIFIGFICYDKFFNTEKPPIPTPVPTDNIIDNKITNLDRIEITDVDQTIYIGEKEYIIKKEVTVDGAFLLIDDEIQEITDLGTAYADFAYVTNEFAFFTIVAQDGESIVYAIDKDGNALTFDDKDYQMQNITIDDGILIARGHIFCGLDGDCPDKDLIIEYKDNVITVYPKNNENS